MDKENDRQHEMFEAPRRRKPKKKVMTPQHRLIVEAFNNNPSLKIKGKPKSEQLRISDTPLFRVNNQKSFF
jgi:hypothetical protein